MHSACTHPNDLAKQHMYGYLSVRNMLTTTVAKNSTCAALLRLRIVNTAAKRAIICSNEAFYRTTFSPPLGYSSVQKKSENGQNMP